MPPTGVDPVRAVADQLREKKGVPYASAKLEIATGDSVYQEYFRGKDLVRYIASNPGKVDSALRDKPGRTDEETAAELVRVLLSRGLIQRTERKFKRPKPGRTRLVKWPRTLLLVKDQSWDPASFYVWKYDRPTSIWYYLGIGAIPVVVIAACLFPLAPAWVRVAVLYLLSGLLMVLLGVILVRYLVFVLVWVLTGCSLWIFPNIMSETVGITEAFYPVVTFEKAKSMADAWKARVVSGAVVAGVLWVLASHTPDISHLSEEARRAHDSLFEYMESMYSRNKTFINGTTEGAGPGPGSRPGGGAGGPYSRQ